MRKRIRQGINNFQKIRFKYVDLTNAMFKQTRTSLIFYISSLFLLGIEIIGLIVLFIVNENKSKLTIGLAHPIGILITVIILVMTSLFYISILTRSRIRQHKMYIAIKRFSFIFTTIITSTILLFTILHVLIPKTYVLDSNLATPTLSGWMISLYLFMILFLAFDKYKD